MIHGKIVTNQWHVQLHDPGNHELAKKIAEDTGFSVLRSHLQSPNEYVFHHKALPHVSSIPSWSHHQTLKAHPLVKSAKQVEGFLRKKRGYKPLKRQNRIPLPTINKKGIPTREKSDSTKGSMKLPTDPLFSKEWYIRNTGQAEGVKDLDLNVLSAWSQGITGKGVTTAIMDDGIDYLHPDLSKNYNAESSYDFSSNDPYPFPRFTDDWFNSHGTRCAGEISAERDNGICGVGVAYDSKVSWQLPITTNDLFFIIYHNM